ncbi:MAG: hypothetical protein KUG81_03960 [Gammaproteobacteria bacterium]|nr:hypothetical protein [Gammaproteobacteria bacterium]
MTRSHATLVTALLLLAGLVSGCSSPSGFSDRFEDSDGLTYFVAEFESDEEPRHSLWRATQQGGSVAERWASAEAVTPLVEGANGFLVTTWPNIFARVKDGFWRRVSTDGELGDFVPWGGSRLPQKIDFNPPLWLTGLLRFADEEEHRQLRNLQYILIDANGDWTPGQDSRTIEFAEGSLNVKEPFTPGAEIFAKLEGDDWFTINRDWSRARGPFQRLERGVFWSLNPADPAVFTKKQGWWPLEGWETLHLLPQNLVVGVNGEHERFATYSSYNGNGSLSDLLDGVIEREPLQDLNGTLTVIVRTDAGYACLALIERRTKQQWGVEWDILIQGEETRSSLAEAIPKALADAARSATAALAEKEQEAQEELRAQAESAKRLAVAAAAAHQARGEAIRKMLQEGEEARRKAEAERAALLAAETPTERSNREAQEARELADEEVNRIQAMRNCACAGTGLHVVGWRERYGVGHRLVPQHLYVVRGQTDRIQGTWSDTLRFTPYTCPECNGANRLDDPPAWTEE